MLEGAELEKNSPMECDSISVDEESASNSLSTEDEEGGQQADNEEEEEESPEEGREEEEDEGSGSEMGVATCTELELRRADLVAEVGQLEAEFAAIKDSLFAERLRLIDEKLVELQEGRAPEYLAQVAAKEENARIRKQVAQVLRNLELESAMNTYESQVQGAAQDCENEKLMLYARLKEDLTNNIRRWEEERHSKQVRAHITEAARARRRHRAPATSESVESKRKPVSIAAPYMVYMLSEDKINQDITQLNACSPTPGRPIEVRCDDSRLLYEGQWLSRGHMVTLRDNQDRFIIVGVSPSDLLLKTSSGERHRVTLASLRKGAMSIKRIF